MNNVLDLNNLKQVPLHPSLQERMCKGMFGKMISHPLLHEIMYVPEMNELYNKQYEMKLAKCHEAHKDKNWTQYVWWFERPYRIFGFELIESELSDKEYWSLLSKIWIDAENICQNLRQWKKWLRSKRTRPELFMTPGDRNHLQVLPDPLTIYRGCIKGANELGLSYTVAKDRAEWFSKRFIRKGQEPIIITRSVPKSSVFAYLGGRGEQEIIIHPKYAKEKTK